MTDRHERLVRARRNAGFKRQRDALEAFPDWNRNTYKSNENGNATFSFEQAQVYAKAFNVDATWLYSGIGVMQPHVQRFALEEALLRIPESKRDVAIELATGAIQQFAKAIGDVEK